MLTNDTAPELFERLDSIIKENKYVESAMIRRELADRFGYELRWRPICQTGQDNRTGQNHCKAVGPDSQPQKNEPRRGWLPSEALDSQPCSGGRDLAQFCDE
jgi:hypothetical protein